MSEECSQVAIITGCARRDGIGAAVASRLASQGIAVAVTDLPSDRAEGPGADDALDEFVESLRTTGSKALACRGDVASEADCRSIVASAVDAFGPPTILVNNAAAPHGADRAFVTEVPLQAWEAQLNVNLTGEFLMARAVVPAMIAGHYGRIVNIASVAGLIGGVNRTAYSASKAGILGLTRALAAELAGYSITVNAVCLGAIATSRAVSTARRRGGDDSVPQALAQQAAAIPAGRFGVPADIAGAVAYLASPEAGYVTGQTLVVDGGASVARV